MMQSLPTFMYQVQFKHMSYQTYITKAIVCGSKASNTSDKSYLLFTQELGMLWATARSVRVEKSKQRFALQDFSIIRVSLVQGKATWRIGSVEALLNPFLAATSRESRGGVSFIVKSLRQYVHGESSVPRAFTDTEALLRALATLHDTEAIAMYQQVFSLRLLAELGYVKVTEDIKKLIEKEAIQEAIDAYDLSLDSVVTKCIEHASGVSHL
jgi:recombinational DNA repair protein (RecF pathway)